MADVKDILGVPRGVVANAQQDAPKTKERMQRPAGMSREAFALLDGSHPIPPSHLAVDLNKKAALAGLKQKRKFSSKGLLTYQFRPFTNPARKDGLVLQHWVKCFKDTAGKLREADETYPFAKFNKQVLLQHICSPMFFTMIVLRADRAMLRSLTKLCSLTAALYLQV